MAARNPDMNAGLTFNEVADMYLGSKLDTVKEITMTNYILCYNKHLRPVFGNCKFTEIKPETILSLSQSLNNNDYSAETTVHLRNLLRLLGKFAKQNLGFANPFTPARMKNFVGSNGQVTQDFMPEENTRIANPDEMRLIIEYSLENSDTTGLCVILAYCFGVTLSEICALKWSDFDLANMVFRVWRNTQRVKVIETAAAGAAQKTKIVFTELTTGAGRREIAIPGELTAYFSAMRNSDNCYVASGHSATVSQERSSTG
jgi:integrase